jgi:polar amino acid transport system substrate-binding protein
MLAMTVLLTGCSSEKTAKIDKISDLGGKVIGMASPVTSAETVKAEFTKFIGAAPKEIVYFNSSNDAITSILAGKTDAAYVMKFSADYYVKKNTDLKIITGQKTTDMNAVMAVRSEDKQLQEDLDKAITTLRENGTLKKLQDEWITNLTANNEPTNKEIPKIAGAKTIYVGVTGNEPPLDFIAADGRPAGFNVALLTEIGKLLNINFEVVSVESQARFTALSSKKIDVVFPNLSPNDREWTKEAKNDTWIATEPYYTFGGACFLVRK